MNNTIGNLLLPSTHNSSITCSTNSRPPAPISDASHHQHPVLAVLPRRAHRNPRERHRKPHTRHKVACQRLRSRRDKRSSRLQEPLNRLLLQIATVLAHNVHQRGMLFQLPQVRAQRFRGHTVAIRARHSPPQELWKRPRRAPYPWGPLPCDWGQRSHLANTAGRTDPQPISHRTPGPHASCPNPTEPPATPNGDSPESRTSVYRSTRPSTKPTRLAPTNCDTTTAYVANTNSTIHPPSQPTRCVKQVTAAPAANSKATSTSFDTSTFVISAYSETMSLRDDVLQGLTGPDGYFPVQVENVRGHDVPVLANRRKTLRDFVEGCRATRRPRVLST